MGYKCYFCEYERGPLGEQSEICKECRDFNNFQVKKRISQRQFLQYERLKHEEEKFANQNSVSDRDTALTVLKDLSVHMRPGNDLFGNRTLVINRDTFELIRKKYLDKKENEK